MPARSLCLGKREDGTGHALPGKEAGLFPESPTVPHRQEVERNTVPAGNAAARVIPAQALRAGPLAGTAQGWLALLQSPR